MTAAGYMFIRCSHHIKCIFTPHTIVRVPKHTPHDHQSPTLTPLFSWERHQNASPQTPKSPDAARRGALSLSERAQKPTVSR